MITAQGGASSKRSSNLELARIIAMLSIIAHHYVVNSGVIEIMPQQGLTLNMLFMQLWGMWGKTAINVFVLITGYFMCEKDFGWRRFAKLILQIEFWRILLLPLFFVVGLPAKEGVAAFVGLLFQPLMGVNNSFTASYLMFYLTIPVLKYIVDGGKRLHSGLIALMLAVNTVAFTFFKNDFAFSEVTWYATLFLIAAWLRRYPPTFMGDHRVCRALFAVSMFAAVASVLCVDALSVTLGTSAYGKGLYFVSQSGKVMALAVGLSLFMYFRSLPMRNSLIVNNVAATTFGVLLIHANSNAMRQLLWVDLLDVRSAFLSPLPMLLIHAVVSMVAIFTVCSLLDWIRLRYAEPRYMAWYDAHEGEIASVCSRVAALPGHVSAKLNTFVRD